MLVNLPCEATEYPLTTYHEYTSSWGGNHFLPAAVSRFKNLFNSRNSFDATSSFRRANQLSCKVFISSSNKAFCSAVKPAIHFCLSNVTGAETAADVEPELADFGAAPKKEDMLPLTLVFLVSINASVVPAFLFKVAIMQCPDCQMKSAGTSAILEEAGKPNINLVRAKMWKWSKT